MSIKLKREVEKLMDECCDKEIFPGANLYVRSGGEEVFLSCGKKAVYPNEEENSLETIYDIASLTKVVVTTTLIMQLIDRKLISLDTIVSEILPEFKNKDITIFDLLTHTSGLPADVKLDLTANIEIIKTKIFNCKKTYERGTKVVYSDIGFITLGLIIEKVLNNDLSTIANENIFMPLGMMDTGFCPDSRLLKRIAPTEISPHFNKLLRGEVHDRKAFLMGGVSGHAGVFSTIKDLALFAKMILNNGNHNDMEIISKGSIEKLFTTYTPECEINRSLGYLTYDIRSPFSKYNSSKSIFHTGFTGTSLLIDKEKETVIILLSNRVHPSRNNVKIIEERKRIHDKILEI